MKQKRGEIHRRKQTVLNQINNSSRAPAAAVTSHAQPYFAQAQHGRGGAQQHSQRGRGGGQNHQGQAFGQGQQRGGRGQRGGGRGGRGRGSFQGHHSHKEQNSFGGNDIQAHQQQSVSEAALFLEVRIPLGLTKTVSRPP